MPRNRKYPTKSELRDLKSALAGKTGSERDKLLANNRHLKDTMRRVTSLGSTGRNRGTSITTTEAVLRRIDKGKVPTGPRKGP